MSNNDENNDEDTSQNMEFEYQNEILFYGYIRTINTKVSIKQIVPRDIILLCYRFFYIEPMKQLKQRREIALEVNDNESVFDIEQLIFYKACRTSLNEFNKTMLDTVIANWFGDNTDEYCTELYRDSVIQCATQCIWSDNVEVLKVIFKKCQYESLFNENKSSFTVLENRRMDEIIRFINVSIVWNAIECAKYLLEYGEQLDWTNEFLPDILLNAVIHQHKNIDFVWFVIKQLEKNAIAFKYITYKKKWADIMEKVIQFDLIDIAKCIVSEGWHDITQNDKTFGAYLDEQYPNKCYQWLSERSSNYVDVNINHMMQIDLDDSGWDTESDDTVDF
eukprot:942520_1